MAFITRLSLLTNTTSMGKRIKKVCMELHGLRIIAWPLLNSFLPKRPFVLLKRLLAIITSSAKIVFLVLLIILIPIILIGDTSPQPAGWQGQVGIGFRNVPTGRGG